MWYIYTEVKMIKPETRRIVALLVFSSVLLAPLGAQSFFSSYFDFSEGFADDNTGLTSFPILQIPMGVRYEAMGTAFTALADDFSYLDANPAASVLLDRTQIALAHNAWIADTSIDSAVYTFRNEQMGFGFASKFPLCALYRV